MLLVDFCGGYSLLAYDGRPQVAVISVNLEMTILLIVPARLIASCFSIADFCLLGEKMLIAYNEHKLIESSDYEVQCAS